MNPVHPVLISPPIFRRTLLAWFRREKRDLPWRRKVTPYRTWISEIMLQQTTVATVAPRFEAWIRRWPDPAALAQASEEELLRTWEGLGYYNRARNLGRAARLIVERHGGRIPDDSVALRTLPGIGEYTAAAILSIAFGRPTPLIDANVRRVMARLLGLSRSSADNDRRMKSTLERLISRRAPGAFNEAMMELGALVCLPEHPLCDRCPAARFCEAARRGEFQIAAKRTSITERRTVVAVMIIGKRVLLRCREKSEINAGMWSFPILAARPDHDKRMIPLPPRIHAYTRYRERIEPFLTRIARPRRTFFKTERWVTREECDRLPMPSTYRRIMNEAWRLAREVTARPVRRPRRRPRRPT